MLPDPISVPGLPANNNTYSQAVRLNDLVFVSGQLGVRPGTKELAGPGIPEQTRQALDNIARILDAAGSSMGQVAKVNIFITDFTLLAEMNAVYAGYFPHRPAKTTVEIARLDLDALIEIEVISSCRPTAIP
ncbi:MAG: RidA family protein [Bryobacterales bacterium]|nr:RidA family protein [Bryobacterales bacterium]